VEFVDSNVLIYAYDASAGSRYDRAKSLVKRLGSGPEGAVSVQVLQEFYVNVVGKIEQRLTPEDARGVVRTLSRWPVHSPGAADVLEATVIAEENTISFWDAMIVRSAAQLGCTTLWSEDLNDGQTIAGITVRNPFGAHG